MRTRVDDYLLAAKYANSAVSQGSRDGPGSNRRPSPIKSSAPLFLKLSRCPSTKSATILRLPRRTRSYSSTSGP
jgi:hypothetical protein